MKKTIANLRIEFNKEKKLDAVQTTRSVGERTYAFDYVHWLEDKVIEKWKDVNDELPDEEINVLCFHSNSSNYFICYRTFDCLTNEPKWFGGAMPTHWKHLDKPIDK